MDEDADTADDAAVLRRQSELEVYLRALLRLPQVARSLSLKRFLSSADHRTSADHQATTVVSSIGAGIDGRLPHPVGAMMADGGGLGGCTPEMVALPRVENWMRFRAEQVTPFPCHPLPSPRAMPSSHHHPVPCPPLTTTLCHALLSPPPCALPSSHHHPVPCRADSCESCVTIAERARGEGDKAAE